MGKSIHGFSTSDKNSFKIAQELHQQSPSTSPLERILYSSLDLNV